MKRDGWWWHDAALTNKNIKRQILKEMLAKRFGARGAFDNHHSRADRRVTSRTWRAQRWDEAIDLSSNGDMVCSLAMTISQLVPKNVDARRGHGQYAFRMTPSTHACLTCFSRPGSISSPFISASGAL